MMNKKNTLFTIKKLLPFLILGIAFFFIVLKINMDYSDDLFYKNISYGFLRHMKRYYKTWGSCVLPLSVGYWLVRLPVWIFRISILITVLFTAYCLSVICKPTQESKPTQLKNSNNDKLLSVATNYVIVFFMLLYPFKQMHTAGWAITFSAYFYPLALGLYSFLYLTYTIRKQKIRFFQYPLFFLAIIFACNNIQLCCIIFGIYLVYNVYFLLQKKVHPFAIIQNIVAFAILIFHLTNPGNANRAIIDTQMHFPDFNMISSLQKIKMGFTATLGNLISTPNVFFIIFALVLAIGVFYTHKNIFYRCIAIIPVLLSLPIKTLNNGSQDFVQITSTNFFVWSNYISIFLGFLLIASIMISFYLIFENTLKTIFIELLFLAGFASRMIMSFSPTIYFSGTRTFIYLYFALIICGVFVFNHIVSHIKTASFATQPHVKPKLVFFILLVFILLSTFFSFAIFHSYSNTEEIDVKNYSSKNILFDIESITPHPTKNHIVTIQGWATKKGQNERLVKTFVAVQNTKTGKVYKINTLMQKKAGLTKKINDHYVHSLAGFISTLNVNSLPKGNYEICILYLSDNNTDFVACNKFFALT